MGYNPQKIEPKWQDFWEKNKVFEIDLKKTKTPYYNLMMFPYPSAEGLHVGNVYAFTGSDIHGRFRKMKGNDVFEPIGFDAFGIHSENFAIQKRIHPKVLIRKNIDNFRRQLKDLGCLFDWRYEVDTTNPDYYKWTQWLFVQLFKAGLAYRKKAPVDWCPSCKTVLADEQVINGRCERCDNQVIQKEMEQWFFKITKYAEKLLKNLKWIDWSDKTKAVQRNWIGKSEGIIEKWNVEGTNLTLETFTTWPHTTFGATFHAVAPEHPIVAKLVKGTKYEKGVERFIEEVKHDKIKESTSAEKEKKGFFTGRYAINFLTGEKMPIYIANFAVMGYGTGIVKGAPAHDQRDFEFAKKYKIPIIIVVTPKDKILKASELKEAYVGPGVMVKGTGKFKGMPDWKAKKAVAAHAIKIGHGKKATHYHLRDWLISRQRYWGPPIPIIYCKKCGTVPVPEKDLPVLLPHLKNFRPTGTGRSPLASSKDFVNTKCPRCKGLGYRETDVSDTFLDSAWYFFRYPSAKLKDKAFDKGLTKKWLPVDMYIGGQEHAVLHLMYSRFITMVLRDLGFVSFEEPFKRFRAHGLLTKGGAKMSKSKGNVVNPDDYYQKYGADTLRMYLMFLGPFSQGGDWQDKGVLGVYRFLNKVWNLDKKLDAKIKNKKIEITAHKTIKKVTEDIEDLKYNTAISALMIFVNDMEKENKINVQCYKYLLLLLAPFAPYITEELWHQIGNKNSIHNQKWPSYDKKLIKEETITLVIQVNGKVRDKIEAEPSIQEKEAHALAISREKIKNRILDKKVKKVIFVPGKLINIVI